jgi:hypothetical protein
VEVAVVTVGTLRRVAGQVKDEGRVQSRSDGKASAAAWQKDETEGILRGMSVVVSLGKVTQM